MTGKLCELRCTTIKSDARPPSTEMFARRRNFFDDPRPALWYPRVPRARLETFFPNTTRRSDEDHVPQTQPTPGLPRGRAPAAPAPAPGGRARAGLAADPRRRRTRTRRPA